MKLHYVLPFVVLCLSCFCYCMCARAQVATRSVLQSMCISVGGWDPLSIDLWLVHVVL